MTASNPRMPAVGAVLCNRRLGSAASYIVRAHLDDHVELEVVKVPGLRAGERFRFSRDAVTAMEQLRPATRAALAQWSAAPSHAETALQTA